MARALKVKRDIFERVRKNMVRDQLVVRGIKDRRVLEAMETVPRHLFVEEGLYAQAYNDYPLPIGEKQTISQPFMVALMTETLGLVGTERVLEIGTGSGYQTAVLSLLAERVYSVERISTLAARARRLLDDMHCTNVVIHVGDGTMGLAEEAPFDAIIVTAASPEVPSTYLAQLAQGGRLVIPVGTEFVQELIRITKKNGSYVRESLGGCRFVKLVGKYGWNERTES